jgi:CII-binding regulator of phage lambda lysogenization HflD
MDEMRVFCSVTNNKMNELKGEAFDTFYKKIELVTDSETNNQIWQRNHNQIVWAISTLLQECGRMPTSNEIAVKAELSIKTVEKHLNSYSKDERYLATVEQFKFMISKVLAKVFKFAINGDMKAAKLYFDVVSNLSGSTVVNKQNNYIQINQFKITQEELKQLKPEELQKVEDLLKEVVSNRI